MIKCLFSYPQRYSPNIFAAALIPLFTGLVSYGFIDPSLMAFQGDIYFKISRAGIELRRLIIIISH